MRILPTVAAFAAFLPCAVPALTAQRTLPRLHVPASAPFLGAPAAATVTWDLTGVPGAPFVILADVDGGPVHFLGERFQLGFTPLTVTFAAGQLPAWGQQLGQVSVTFSSGLLNVPFHLQGVVLGSGAPNGAFEATNGESTTLTPPWATIEERFDDAVADGFTGTFDPTVRDRLEGGPVRRRTHRTIDPQGTPFQLPLATPLNHYGARAQLCFRARDVGATGEEELLTAVRWRLFGNQLTADRFDSFELLASHSDVVPDYTIDPWTALPRFPNSGLDPVYANNVKPGETPQPLYQGPYAIRPADLRADGFVDYPLAQPFAYNGVDSLLLDLRMSPSAVPGSGANGQIVRLMVLSSAQPNARVVSYGAAGRLIDPNAVRQGRGDNTMYDYQLVFVRVKTVAVSPWRDSGVASPDYQTPVVAKVLPAGTSVVVEYRGADDAQGSGATQWSQNVDIADGKPFLQSRFTLVGDAATGAVPSVDSLVVPLR